MLKGIDISHHQGTVDWTKVATAKLAFAVCKVSQGFKFEDPNWKSYHQGMHNIGITHGFYHFLQKSDKGGGRTQAKRFLDLIGDPTGHLIQLDVEVDSVTGTEPSIGTIYEWADEWFILTNNHPLLLYTGDWFWVGHLKNPPKPPGDVRLWTSEFNNTPGQGLLMYGGWKDWTIHQYGGGPVPGFSNPIDLNVFNGDKPALLDLTGEDMTIEELRRELTTIGTPSRVALLSLAQRGVNSTIGASDVDTDGPDSPARKGISALVKAEVGALPIPAPDLSAVDDATLVAELLRRLGQPA